MTTLSISVLWILWNLSGIHVPSPHFPHTVPSAYWKPDPVCEHAMYPENGKIASEINSRRVYLMGTLSTLHHVSHSAEQSVERMESMVRILEEAESELSTWKEDSILSRLNRQPVGAPLEVESSMIELFEELDYWSGETQNSFDPTVGKLMEAYAIKTGGRWPTAASVKASVQDTGMQHYRLDKKRYRITRTRDIHIDAGSFGKGEALDRLLKAHADDDAWMADLGGQILVHGSRPGRSGWPVSIAHPRNREEAFLSIVLKSGSLATSGGSERDSEVENRRLGHILDPRIGRPAPYNGSVSVWHERALLADILSTALYVMGPEKGLRWANDRGVAACFLIPDTEGNVGILTSLAFREIISGDRFTDSNSNPVKKWYLVINSPI